MHADKDNYTEARNEVQKRIRTKKKAYFESKLTENIGKTKELWKSLTSLGLKFERSNLAENLVSKLPNPSNKYGLLSVAQYCSHLGLTKKSDLLPTEKDYVFKILRDIDTSKAAAQKMAPMF